VAVLVSDIAVEVLSILGVYAPGEPVATADSASLLFTLNGIVDGFAAERLMIFETAILPFSTVIAKQSYKLGPDGTNDWVTTFLPGAVTSIGLLTVGGTLEIPLALYTLAQWQAIALKATAGVPTACWPQYGAVFHTLNFWPVPNVVSPVLLYVQKQIPLFTSVTNTVLLPPGYQELLTYELALKSVGKFGREVPAWLPAAWRAARTRVEDRAALASRGNRVGADSSVSPATKGV